MNWYFLSSLCRSEPVRAQLSNLGSLYKGLMKDMFVNFKHLRQTRHTHHLSMMREAMPKLCSR